MSPPYLTKFGDNRHCVCGDIMRFVCYVIPQNHMINVSCDLMSESPSWQVSIMPTLLVIGIAVEKIQCFTLSCDLTRPHDQRLK